ncbi:hypothetical protein [Sphingobium ummariense]
MKMSVYAILLALVPSPGRAADQPSANRETDLSVTDAPLILSGVQASRVDHLDADARLLTVSPPNPSDDATFATVQGITAQDFVVDAILMGVPIDKNSTARGFVGIAFRISDDRERFEAIYLRPTNARANDQLRRNHTTQYISHPEYPWERLRDQHPGKYESYVDVDADQWTKIKLVVSGSLARFYVNEAAEPALIVNDLKLPPASGGIGLWVGPGSKGYFKSLKVTVTRP